LATIPESVVIDSYLSDFRQRAEDKMRSKEWASAIEYWIKVVNLNPNDAESFSKMAMAYLMLGDRESAEDCCREAIRLDKNCEEYKIKINEIFRSSSLDRIP